MATNNMLVKRLRKTLIQIEFNEGQIVQNNYKIENDLNNQITIISEYYNNQLTKCTNLLNEEDQNEKYREKHLAKLVNKHYWQKRRYKQKYLKSDDLKEILKELEINQEKIVEAYKEKLLVKYPPKNLVGEKRVNLTNKLEGLEHLKKDKIEKATAKNILLIEKLTNKNKKILSKIDLLKAKENALSTQIKQLNNDLLEESKNRLPDLYRKIDVLEADLNILKEDSKEYKVILKKSNKLKAEVHKINSYINVNENSDIHLAISELKMYFGGIKALDGVSFNVKKGEIFGLIGPNGAGKTTVFNCLTQFYNATAGTVYFDNKEGNITNLMNVKVHNIIKEGIARSFQNIEMVWELTILDNLLVAAHSIIMSDYLGHMIHSRKMKKEEEVLRIKGMQILEMLGIAEYAFRIPYGLPYGVLKKVELARTLMTNPTMIILDEPAAGLNDLETKDLAKTIKKINQELNITIFLVEHDMQLVMSICDTVCAINFGKMLAIGTPKEIQNNSLVRKAYLGED